MEDFFLHLEQTRREAQSKKNNSSVVSEVADLYLQLLSTKIPLSKQALLQVDTLLSQVHQDLPEEDFFHSLWLFNARARYAHFIEHDIALASNLALSGLSWSLQLFKKKFTDYEMEKKSYPLITTLVLARLEGYRGQTDQAQRQMKDLLEFCENPLTAVLAHFPKSVQVIFTDHRNYWNELLQGFRKCYFTNKIKNSLDKAILFEDLLGPTDLPNAIFRNAINCPNDIALKDYDTKDSLTWRQWLSSAHQLSADLEDLAQKSQYVIICSRHSLFLPVSLMACWLKNKTPLLINDEITDLEFTRIKKLLQEDNPAILIESRFPEKTKIKFENFSSTTKASETPRGDQPFPSAFKTSPDSLALGLFTSGTSDLPKLILFTHENLLASAKIEGENEGRFKRIANLRPSFTSGGLNTLWPGILFRSCQVFSEVLRKRPVFRYLRDFLEDEDPELLVLSPSYIQALIESDDGENLSSKSLPVYFGGTSLPKSNVQLLQSRGLHLSMRYGMTEVGHIISRVSADVRNSASQVVGIAFKNFEIKSENEYLQIRSLGAAEFKMVDGGLVSLKVNQWFTTEDRGHISSDREITLLGREHSVLCVDGFRFHASQTETALLSSQWLKDCRVVATQDSKHGQKITAFCIPSLEVSESLERQLRLFAQAHLSPPLRPSRYEFLKEYPTLPNGKINYRELRDRLKAIPEREDERIAGN